MNIKKITAALLSTATLAAAPSVPVLGNTVQNISMTAHAVYYAPDTYLGDIWRNSIGYSLYKTSRDTYYAAVIGTSPYMKELTLPESVTYQGIVYPVQIIEENAFQYSNVKTFTVNSESMSIKAGAFHDASIQTFVFNGKYCAILDEAFLNSDLVSIRFGSKTESITFDTKAFSNTVQLSDVVFENPDVFLFLSGSYIFAGSSVCNITLPETVTSLPTGCFEDCTNLTNLKLPSVITSIGQRAFENAVLPSVMVLPAAMNSIGYNAFSCVQNVAEYVLDASNPYFFIEDGVLYQRNAEQNDITLVSYPPNKTNPDFECHAQHVLSGSVANNPYLVSLDITNLQLTNGSPSFSKLPNLEYMYIPDAVYNNGTAEEILNRFQRFFSETKLHFLNEEAVTVKAGQEPELTGKLGAYIAENFEKKSENSILKYYTDTMADYVVDQETDDSMSDLEKAVRLRQWIMERAIYDPDVMKYDWQKKHNEEADEKLNNPKDHVDASVFLHKKADGKYYTVCEGYAKCYKLLMNKANVKTDCVSGPNFDEKLSGHAWNIVQLDGKWYHVDLTWDDKDYYYDPNKEYNGVVADRDLCAYKNMQGRYRNFLCSDYLFGRDDHRFYKWAAHENSELNWQIDNVATDSTVQMLGDVNGDFLSDYRDLNYLQRYLLSDPNYRFDSYEHWKRADVNLDGNVNVFDLTYLRRYYNLYGGEASDWSFAAWRFSKLEK